MSRIYVETSIPSFYHEVRTEPTMVARRQWTREWFDAAVARVELVTSAAVLDELERGDFPGRTDAMAMIQELSPLRIGQRVRTLGILSGGLSSDYPGYSQSQGKIPPLIVPAVLKEIVKEYIDRQLMPADPSGDALHLALASYYACDFLVTWNCKHLANANKFGHIAQVNRIMKLAVPSLVTPLELLGTGTNDNA